MIRAANFYLFSAGHKHIPDAAGRPEKLGFLISQRRRIFRLTRCRLCFLIVRQRTNHLLMSGRHTKKKPEDTFYRDLGSAIRLARVTAGKSQAEVAEHLGLTFQQLQKYESGKNRIPVQELASLAAYLEVSVAYLIGSPGSDAGFRSFAEKFRATGFHTLLESWAAIKDQPMRAAVINLVKRAAAMSR
jgi:transcriptional regulator with XRE-family HTH domain